MAKNECSMFGFFLEKIVHTMGQFWEENIDLFYEWASDMASHQMVQQIVLAWSNICQNPTIFFGSDLNARCPTNLDRFLATLNEWDWTLSHLKKSVLVANNQFSRVFCDSKKQRFDAEKCALILALSKFLTQKNSFSILNFSHDVKSLYKLHWKVKCLTLWSQAKMRNCSTFFLIEQ